MRRLSKCRIACLQPLPAAGRGCRQGQPWNHEDCVTSKPTSSLQRGIGQTVPRNSRIFSAIFFTLLILLLTHAPLLAQTRTVNGVPCLSLSEVAGRLGMRLQSIQYQKEVKLKSQWSQLEFKQHQRYFYLNGYRMPLGYPIALIQGKLWISQLDFEKTIQPLLTLQNFAKDCPKLYHIVVDAGHGGHDSGALNKALNLNEKSTTLDLAQRLKQKLEKLGYRVTLTRNSDQFIPLATRAAVANQLKADLFISLHFNAVDSNQVEGVETFAMTPAGLPSSNQTTLNASARKSYPGNQNDTWNTLAAFNLQQAILKQLKPVDRGVKHARFVVLKDLNCPGALVEGGFITHTSEGRKVGSSAYRDKLANALAQGVLAYQKNLNQVRSH